MMETVGNLSQCRLRHLDSVAPAGLNGTIALKPQVDNCYAWASDFAVQCSIGVFVADAISTILQLCVYTGREVMS